MLLRFQKAAGRGNYETGNQAFSKRLRFLTIRVLYCFFIIGHDRRRILHFNVTRHPTSTWIVQQLREAFPYDSAPRFLLFDHDAKYGLEVPASIRSLKMTPVRLVSRPVELHHRPLAEPSVKLSPHSAPIR